MTFLIFVAADTGFQNKSAFLAILAIFKIVWWIIQLFSSLGTTKQLVICTDNTGSQFLYRHDQALNYKCIDKITNKLVNLLLTIVVVDSSPARRTQQNDHY